MMRTAVFLAAWLVMVISAQTAEPPNDAPMAPEQKLHGEWKGGACQGDWSFGPDGAFVLQHYSPGNNRLTGTWQVRWDAIPPTLAVTFKTTDAPDRIKVGEMWKVKLTQLDDEVLAYEWPRTPGKPLRWVRMKR